jgi:quinol monooxygenase YgiN
MYARVTTFKVDPSRLSELSTKIKEMAPAAKSLPGIVDVYIAWRTDGQGVVTSVYDSKASADSATAKIQAIWGTVSGLLSGAPKTVMYESVEHIVG